MSMMYAVVFNDEVLLTFTNEEAAEQWKRGEQNIVPVVVITFKRLLDLKKLWARRHECAEGAILDRKDADRLDVLIESLRKEVNVAADR